MRRSEAVSLRGFALAASFCALSIAAGCGQETFDLLPSAGAAAGAGSAPAGAGAGVGEAGSGASGAGAGGSSGGAAELGGSSGKGAGGRGGFPTFGGAAGNPGPCASAAQGCALECTDSTPFCSPCDSQKDCPGDAFCDLGSGRCVQCRRNSDCGGDFGCNVTLGRCAKKCKNHGDCVQDGDRLLCDAERGVCVACLFSSHCVFLGETDAHCYAGACVECFADDQCLSDLCVAGRCVNKH